MSNDMVATGPDIETFEQTAERLRRSIAVGYYPAIAESIRLYASKDAALPTFLAEAAAAALDAAWRSEPIVAGPMSGRTGNASAYFERLRIVHTRWSCLRRLIDAQRWLDEPSQQAKHRLAQLVSDDLKKTGGMGDQLGEDFRGHVFSSAASIIEAFNEVETAIGEGKADLYFAVAGWPLPLWRGQEG